MLPLLFPGVHGSSGKVVTEADVKEVWERNKGRKVPIVPGHPLEDDVKALGLVRLERLLPQYVDETGTLRGPTILGRMELNGAGKEAVSRGEYLYYSPALKKDAAAGLLMRHVGLVNDPAQAGLPALQDLIILSDTSMRLTFYDKAEESAPWNFQAADYDVKQLARASAYVEGMAGNPHTAAVPDDLTKAACHLPHHKPDLTLVWRGVAAAAAALAGARGGVKISDDAKRKARAHLAEHYKEFGRELDIELNEGDSMVFTEEQERRIEELIEVGLKKELEPFLEKLTGVPEADLEASGEEKALSDENAKLALKLNEMEAELKAQRFFSDLMDKGCPKRHAVMLSDLVRKNPASETDARKFAEAYVKDVKLFGGIDVVLSEEREGQSEREFKAGLEAGRRAR